MSTIKCPKCGSNRVRPSLTQSWIERVLETFGFVQIRCRDCDERFGSGLIDVRNAIYARCPRCYRLDLGSWKLDHYHVTFWSRVLLKIGGRPRRCDACRWNFVSFRPVKIAHVRRAKRTSPTQPATRELAHP